MHRLKQYAGCALLLLFTVQLEGTLTIKKNETKKSFGTSDDGLSAVPPVALLHQISEHSRQRATKAGAPDRRNRSRVGGEASPKRRRPFSRGSHRRRSRTNRCQQPHSPQRRGSRELSIGNECDRLRRLTVVPADFIRHHVPGQLGCLTRASSTW